jgi:hypothetical protein
MKKTEKDLMRKWNEWMELTIDEGKLMVKEIRNSIFVCLCLQWLPMNLPALRPAPFLPVHLVPAAFIDGQAMDMGMELLEP